LAVKVLVWQNESFLLLFFEFDIKFYCLSLTLDFGGHWFGGSGWLYCWQYCWEFCIFCQ